MKNLLPIAARALGGFFPLDLIFSSNLEAQKNKNTMYRYVMYLVFILTHLKKDKMKLTPSERQEFRELSGKLFGGCMIATFPKSHEAHRYNELCRIWQAERLAEAADKLPEFARNLLAEIIANPEKEYQPESTHSGNFRIHVGIKLLVIAGLIRKTDHNKTTGYAKYKLR